MKYAGFHGGSGLNSRQMSWPGVFANSGRMGFSAVEIMVVAFVGSLMLITFQSFFSQGVKSSMKGMDTLESIRAAGQLFTQMRKDLRGCEQVDTGASLTLALNPRPAANCLANLSFNANVVHAITFRSRNATMTYTLAGATPTSSGYIARQEEKGGVVTQKNFAVPRMKTFDVVKIAKEQQVKAGQDVFEQEQLWVRVEVESNDPRFPTGKIALSTFFVSGQMSRTNWWNYWYPAL